MRVQVDSPMQETNFSRSIASALWLHKIIFEGRFLDREILQRTRPIFETTSYSNVVK